MQSGETIESSMVIWAAGIKGNVPEGVDKSIIVKGNRITVDRFNKVKGTENIYAIGDVAYMETEKYPHGHPQVASVAIAQGTVLSDNLIRLEKNLSMKEFEYHDKGTMATVGRNLAVVDIPIPNLNCILKDFLRGLSGWACIFFYCLVLRTG